MTFKTVLIAVAWSKLARTNTAGTAASVPFFSPRGINKFKDQKQNKKKIGKRSNLVLWSVISLIRF